MQNLTRNSWGGAESVLSSCTSLEIYMEQNSVWSLEVCPLRDPDSFTKLVLLFESAIHIFELIAKTLIMRHFLRFLSIYCFIMRHFSSTGCPNKIWLIFSWFSADFMLSFYPIFKVIFCWFFSYFSADFSATFQLIFSWFFSWFSADFSATFLLIFQLVFQLIFQVLISWFFRYFLCDFWATFLSFARFSSLAKG